MGTKRAYIKTLILTTLLITGLVSSCAREKGESTKKLIHSGELWLDTNGEHINAHGGGILFKDGIYYWFGEHKTEGRRGNTSQVGVGCYSSKDLVNWTNEGIALKVDTVQSSEIVQGCVIERPKVIFNNKTRKYVMWFHLELKGQGYNAAKTGVAISEHITGPYAFLESVNPNKNQWPLNYPDSLKTHHFPVEFEWWTPPFLTDINLGLFLHRDFNKGQMSRDMTLFVDDDGTAYHVHSSEDNLTIHISQLSEDYLTFTEKWIRVFPGGHNEAPAMFKHNDKYYMMTSGCTGWSPNKARLAVADSILGPWSYLENPCLGEDADKTFHSQSTFILKVQGRSNAFIYMGDRWRPRNPIDGRYVWLPFHFEDGQPRLKWLDKWSLETFKTNSNEK